MSSRFSPVKTIYYKFCIKIKQNVKREGFSDSKTKRYPDEVKVSIFLPSTSNKYFYANLAECSRAPKHPPASVKINNQSASRFVLNFIYDVFCIELILSVEFRKIKCPFKSKSFTMIKIRLLSFSVIETWEHKFSDLSQFNTLIY